MSLIKRVAAEHCEKKGLKNVDIVERDLRWARDNYPNRPLNKTIRGLLNRYMELTREK